MNSRFLDGINNSGDVKKLSIPQLHTLCSELREYILSVVSQNGGHLASNLGVIELSVALEYVFDTSTDRLVWDVGHQSYAHKILTGRREAFQSLRQADGLSGFPKRKESSCDPYDTGHSSTSISAALGFAKARDLLGDGHKVIALIGDGSMTGGQAFEALNLAGDLETDILVILNDNHMSIAPNIGGMSHYLNRLRSSRAYTGSKQAVRGFLAKIPFVGNALVRIIEKLKDSLRYILLNGIVFSELGFQYYGPVDGHDLPELIRMLKQVMELKGPVLLHVVTQKGRGYKPAAENATVYHGISPFDLVTGKTSLETEKTTQTYTEAFSETLTALAGENSRIIAITAAMANGTGLDKFHQLYPERFFDVGIAEQTAVSFGTALALSGFRPVVAVYSSFMQRAYDQLIQDTALQDAPVVFALDRSGLVGEDGPTHHGVFDLSYLNQIPTMSVLIPRDEFMLSHMLKLACAYEKGPVALRYPRGKGVGVAAIEKTDHSFNGAPQWGKGQLLRSGGQTMIIAAGYLVYEALSAAQCLEEEGHDVAVFDPCFLKPLDTSSIWDTAKNCDIVLIAEENVAPGGLGWAVTAFLAQTDYHGQICCLCVPDEFIPQGSQQSLRRRLGLDAEGIATAIRKAKNQ